MATSGGDSSTSAATSPLEQDLTCCVCCDIFREPVVLPTCGHSFCRACLERHWAACGPELARAPRHRRRDCPVCRAISPQEPLPNISLRSTCDSFLRLQAEKNKKEREKKENERTKKEEACAGAQRRAKKGEGGGQEDIKKEKEERVCPEHGQKLMFYCETDGKAVCGKCNQRNHRHHRVLGVERAVRERKQKLEDAAKPLRERLNALRNASADRPTAKEHIQAAISKCERQIRADFETLVAFLQREERARLDDLQSVGRREYQRAADLINAEATQLGNKLHDAQLVSAKDNITFLEEFSDITSTLLSTQLSRTQVGQSPLALIDAPRHLGNLRFNVWKKMQEVAPYYPVILDPIHHHFLELTLADNLTGVTRATTNPILPYHDGSFAQGKALGANSCHVWDVHVGDSLSWHLGVASEHGPIWSLRREEGQYFGQYTFPPTPLHLPSPLPLTVVRVKVLWDWVIQDGRIGRYRKVTFSNAHDPQGSVIVSYSLGGNTGHLYPLLVPMGQRSELRLEPMNVDMKMDLVKELSIWDRYTCELKVLIGVGLVLYIMVVFTLSFIFNN